MPSDNTPQKDKDKFEEGGGISPIDIVPKVPPPHVDIVDRGQNDPETRDQDGEAPEQVQRDDG